MAKSRSYRTVFISHWDRQTICHLLHLFMLYSNVEFRQWLTFLLALQSGHYKMPTSRSEHFVQILAEEKYINRVHYG